MSLSRVDAALVAGGALVGAIVAGWIYTAGCEEGEGHGQLTERVKHEIEYEVERQIKESVRREARRVEAQNLGDRR